MASIFKMSKTKKVKTIDDQFDKLTQREAALIRPDSVVGEVEKDKITEWIYNEKTGLMEFKEMEYSPGAVKVFDEILVNARDASVRDKTVDKIKVNIDKETGRITIFNNGNGIPVKQVEKWDNQWLPEGIFGDMNSGSNFQEDVKKTWGGRNGLGGKLCNIFSTEFTVESKCSVFKKKYTQTWTANMSEKGAPKITSFSSKASGTTVSFVLDWKRFGMNGMEDDFIEIIKRRTYDITACTRDSVNVYWNDTRIPGKTFDKYLNLFLGSTRGGEKRVTEHLDNKMSSPPVEGVEWDIGATLSRDEFKQVSMVNGIWTRKGGTHVNYIRDQIVKKVKAYLADKKKKDVTTNHIRQHLFLFVNATVVDPSFNSQTKEELTLRSSKFGFKCEISDKFIEDLIKKCELGDYVLKYTEFQEKQDLKSANDGVKRGRISNIPNFEDADNAGTRKSEDCILVVTEGISAKTLAISGFSVVGRDNWGVFPLKGKPLNVRNASNKQLLNNKELNYLQQILGLSIGTKVRSLRDLRYGKLMIMADQDLDGSHIKGLLISLFHKFWPELLTLKNANGETFIAEFRTPIVTATKRKQRKEFFSLQDFEEWRDQNGTGGWKIKYIKGLGGNEPIDAKRYFANKDDYIVHFFSESPKTTTDALEKAFDDSNSDLRKTWLIDDYDYNKVRDQSKSMISFEKFVDLELVHYFKYDVERSIANVMDGLKTSQRKVLYACRKENVKDDIKVFQLGGSVAKVAAYHHGDQSLNSTIVGMAQNFAGSNNINWLVPAGQFGSRVEKGKDASAPRYISTRLETIMNKIHPSIDDVLFERKKDDDGNDVEPVHFAPIVPMILINGCEGIGTGFSTTIPAHNPREVIQNLYALLNEKPLQKMEPWYRDYNGQIRDIGDKKYETKGEIEFVDQDTVRVIELPIGTNKCKSFAKYYDFLEESVINPKEKDPKVRKKQFIKSHKGGYTDESPAFEITFPDKAWLNRQKEKGKPLFGHVKTLDELRKNPEELYKTLNLTTTINTSNMYLFDEKDGISKFTSAEDILKHYYKIRLEFYEKRRNYYLKLLEKELSQLAAKIRFLELIMQDRLKIFKVEEEVVIEQLKKFDFPTFEPQNNYSYLLTMQINRFTKQEIDKLMAKRDEKQVEYDTLLSKTPKDLWLAELDELSDLLGIWEKQRIELKKEYAELNELGKKQSRQTKKRKLMITK